MYEEVEPNFRKKADIVLDFPENEATEIFLHGFIRREI